MRILHTRLSGRTSLAKSQRRPCRWSDRERQGFPKKAQDGTARALTFPTLFTIPSAPRRQKEIMRIYSTATITGAVLATFLFGFSAFARDQSAPNETMLVSVVRPEHKPITLVFQRK